MKPQAIRMDQPDPLEPAPPEAGAALATRLALVETALIAVR